ncbi:hypothetical protein AB0D67_37855 [Streptosporangium sp. NPDC048047]|uniref:hypothetical protein n=1 Tax=Streptosporangium sp. NPDC048047 TaxID=3155748 RepID=UPI00342AAB28
MNDEDLTAFGHLVRDADEQRPAAQSGMYEAGWVLSEVTRAAGTVAEYLREQTRTYPSRYILRDDEDQDPQARIQKAGDHLAQMSALLTTANEHARRYHAEIGHLAVQVDPTAEG